MTWTLIAAYCLALFIMAVIPGPGIAALVGNAMGSGFRATIPMAAGLIAGDLTFLTAVILGLTLLLDNLAVAFTVLKLVAAAYILRLAWKIHFSDFALGKVAFAPRVSPPAAFLSGYLVTISNPKVMIFYIALLPTLLPLGHINFQSYLVITGLTAVTLAATVLPYILLASHADKLLTKPIHWKLLRAVAVAIMIAAAGVVLTQII